MKKIAICDDEPAVRKQMEAYFKELESVFCISYFESGETLLESDVLYDVIFLDIDMKGISGIDTARKIRVRDKKAKIIYVTAYEDFREYAFGVHAFGYLVKPVEKEKILEILQEAFDYEQEEQRGPRIRLHTDAGYQEFYMQDICYFEYRDRKIRIVTQNGEAWMRGSISKMAESFQNMGFAVPHKSFVVNLRHIKDIKGCDLLMTTGEIVPLSQKKAADFRAFLTGLTGNLWIGVQIQLTGVLLLGILLFHRKIGSLLLDLFVNILLILSIEVGIFLGNYLLVQGAFENLVWYGNVTMLFKMFFMIPVTAAAVMWKKRQKETEMGNLQILLLLLLPLFSVLFLYSLIEMGRIYMDLYGVRLMVVNLAALVLLNFCFLYLFGYWFRSHKLEGQLAEFQMQNELQYRYYAELEQKYRESRKIIHDMKNHLQAVEHLYQAKDGQEQGGAYVKDLYHMLNLLGEKYYSSNRMLNIICNDKLSLARHPAVAISVEIGDVDFSDLRDIDITTIFANLLDNALEAAEDFGEGAYLNLKIQEVHHFRVISIVNASRPGMKKEGHMGVGLENVRRTVEAYQGTMQCEIVGEEYRVSVMLPGKEDS